MAGWRPALPRSGPLLRSRDPPGVAPREPDRPGTESRADVEADALAPPGLWSRPWSSSRASRPGGTATTTSSPTSSPWSSRAGSTGGPGRSPGRCGGSSAYRDQDVVALAHPPDHPLSVREKALAEELGVRWVHIPIVDERRTGDVQGDLRPSSSGPPPSSPTRRTSRSTSTATTAINRASMVQMAYRTLYCGWTLEQATDEISRTFGLVEVNHGPDYRLMAEFYEERVLPRRAALARADAESSLHR